MNKKLITGLCVAVSAVCCFSFFAGCTDDPMLYAVSKEIKLEEHIVVGTVSAMVPFKDELYASCGKIYKKNPGVIRSWQTSTKPSGIVIKLTAVQDALFALVAATPDADDQTYKVYCSTDGAQWTEYISFSTADDDDEDYGAYMPWVFDNGASGAARRAFIVFKCDADNTTYVRHGVTVGGEQKNLKQGVYELSYTGSAPAISDAPLTGTAGTDSYLLGSGSDTVSTGAASAAYASGIGTVICTAAPDYGTGSLITSNGTDTFYKSTSSGYVHYSNNGTDWTTVSTSGSGTPYALLWYKNEDTAASGRSAAEILLVGNSSCFLEVTLANGIPQSVVTEPTDNAGNQFGTHFVFGLFAPAAAADSAGAGAIYATTGETSSSNYDYLWAYYPVRGNWNCE